MLFFTVIYKDQNKTEKIGHHTELDLNLQFCKKKVS